MNCDQFIKYDTGKIKADDFFRHAENCPVCQKWLDKDIEFMNHIKSLKQPVNNPNMWNIIKPGLEQEVSKSKRTILLFSKFTRYKYNILKVAAIFLLIGIISVYYLPKEEIQYSRILNKTALEKVNQREQEYIQSIDDLEKSAQNKLNSFDINLSLLYRDKIETIDTQIANCKKALENNPANAHIRRYLLYALKDKKETLIEILNLQVNQKKES